MTEPVTAIAVETIAKLALNEVIKSSAEKVAKTLSIKPEQIASP